MKLNLGAADRHIEGFICIDIAPPPCVVCGSPEGRTVNLSDFWPWGTGTVEQALALDVCEHIPDSFGIRREANGMLRARVEGQPLSGRIHFMNELHRILVPGGQATIETPNAARGVGYLQDPTHCSPWCLSTFRYFEHGTFAHGRLSKAYGITAAFKVLSIGETPSNGEQPVEQVWKIKAVLEAVK